MQQLQYTNVARTEFNHFVFAEAEWFDDKIVGAYFEADQNVKFLRLRTDEDDVNIGSDRSSRPTNFVSTVARHHHVKADKVGRLLTKQSNRILNAATGHAIRICPTPKKHRSQQQKLRVGLLGLRILEKKCTT